MNLYLRGSPDSEGRALVLLHGAGSDRLFWGPAASLLGHAGIPTLTMEFPGHGRSPGPPLESVAALADSAKKTLAVAGVRRWVAAGHSLGGAVALTLASGTSSGLCALGAISCGAWLPVDKLVHRGTKEAFACTAENLVRYSFPPGTPARALERGVDAVTRVGSAALHADLTASAGFRLSPEEMSGVGIPVEVVCGSLDRLTPLQLSRELAAALPKGALTVLEGVGHLPPLEAPERVAEVLTDLWGRGFPGT